LNVELGAEMQKLERLLLGLLSFESEQSLFKKGKKQIINWAGGSSNTFPCWWRMVAGQAIVANPKHPTRISAVDCCSF